MITMFGTSMTGSNLQFEIMTGAFERILATPLSRAALMIGRALKELTPLVVQAAIIMLVAVPFGFELYPAHVVVGLLMLGVFGVGVGALSYALAIAARKTEWIFWAVQQTLLFPLLILSGMMLPLESGPRVDAGGVARFNPLTYIVEAERTLFAGTMADLAVLYGFVAAAAHRRGGAVGRGAGDPHGDPVSHAEQLERLLDAGAGRGRGGRRGRARRLREALPDEPGAVLAVHPTLAPARRLAPLLRRQGKLGFVVEDMTDLEEFVPDRRRRVPDGPLYLVHEPDRGDEMRNWSPNEALPAIPSASGRP